MCLEFDVRGQQGMDFHWRKRYYGLLARSYITFSHLADAFIQRDLQMKTMEAIKTNKRAIIGECYNKS